MKNHQRGFTLMGPAGLAAVMMLTGCAKLAPAPVRAPEYSPDQRRAMQTRSWDASADMVFGATVEVFQELGWTLDTVDRAAGLIRATTDRRLESFGPGDERDFDLQERQRAAVERSDVSRKWSRWREAVVHIEAWGDGSTRQRLVLNLRGTLPAMSYLERQSGSFLRRGRESMIHAPPAEQTVEVSIPEVYSDVFDRVDAGVQRRLAAAQQGRSR